MNQRPRPSSLPPTSFIERREEDVACLTSVLFMPKRERTTVPSFYLCSSSVTASRGQVLSLSAAAARETS